jgi:KDO2-lipid IV(A) lauroyltransferase
MRIDGLENLDRALAAGRGVVLASLHLGPFMSLPLALAYRGYGPYVSGGHQLDEGPCHPATIKINIDLEEAGGRWVWVGGSFAVMSALLRRGAICLVMLDPATAEVPSMLAGRPVRLAGGAARLAIQTGATIVPACAVHLRGVPVALIQKPVAAEPGDDERALLSRVAARLDRVVQEHLTQWEPPPEILRCRDSSSVGEPQARQEAWQSVEVC